MKATRRASFDKSGDWIGDFLAVQRAVVAAAGDLDTVMQIVVDGALALLPGSNGAMVLMRDGDVLRVVAASGRSRNGLGMRIRCDGPVCGRVIDTQAPHMISDSLMLNDIDKAIYEKFGIRSAFGVPVLEPDGVAGVLAVQSGDPDAFGTADQFIAELLAGPVAIGLSNRRAADALRERSVADRRFEATFAHAPVGIAHVAPDGSFLRVNDRFCEIVERPREHLLAHGFQAITHPDDLDIDLQHVGSLIAGREDRYAIEKRYLRRDGGAVWVNLTVSLVRDAEGLPDFFVSVIEDLSEIRRARDEALRDPLTGLLNRRGAAERIRRDLARASRRREPLTIAYLDLDGFKAINDHHGHAEGDACLIAVAQAITGAVRSGDAAARVGGDEFVVAMIGLPDAEVMALMARLRAAIAGTRWPVTASIGVYTQHGGAELDPKVLVDRADRAMFRAKQGGKDRVHIERR